MEIPIYKQLSTLAAACLMFATTSALAQDEVIHVGNNASAICGFQWYDGNFDVHFVHETANTVYGSGNPPNFPFQEDEAFAAMERVQTILNKVPEVTKVGPQNSKHFLLGAEEERDLFIISWAATYNVPKAPNDWGFSEDGIAGTVTVKRTDKYTWADFRAPSNDCGAGGGPEPGDVVFNGTFNDNWRDAVKKGSQSFFFVIYPETDYFWMAWYTWDTQDHPFDHDPDKSLGYPGHVWYVGGGVFDGDTALIDLQLVTGGEFLSNKTASEKTVGSMTLQAVGCNKIILNWEFFGNDGPDGEPGEGEIELSRLFDDWVDECEDSQ
jgi:hypothetical protein